MILAAGKYPCGASSAALDERTLEKSFVGTQYVAKNKKINPLNAISWGGAFSDTVPA
jgi:hypothetical protein